MNFFNRGKVNPVKQPKLLKKRQWGTEKNTLPLPILHDRPSLHKITIGRISIVLTIFFWFVYINSTIVRQFIDSPQNYSFTMEAFSYSFVVSMLSFSALMYLTARQGALERFSKHVRVPRSVIEKYFTHHQPSITVLVPSYSEEVSVIRKTLLSASLQEYPNMRIVLLLDDNPNPPDKVSAKKLDATRNLPNQIEKIFSRPHKRFSKALNDFEQVKTDNQKIPYKIVRSLAKQYQWAADWLNKCADNEVIEDHVDVFFTQQVIQELAKDLELVSLALNKSINDKARLNWERVHQLYQRLVWIFKTQVDVFERKQYASLSHEANKAMNLNAYIGLMGNAYKIDQTPDGPILSRVEGNRGADMKIPDSEFILTLDADSILLREYCLRLVYFLKQPGNEKIAVTQTPYSSFRGAYTRIERISGATTDIQHILHQGLSQFGATFWVGANAVIRKIALEDIVQKEWIGGYEINRYIQDRTVIEDTESSIDLAVHGWKLVNYPERLSYSATPPDFGALIIQRRRWANGGLLILPKLWSQIKERKNNKEIISNSEVLLRLNYMASIAWATFGLIFLLAYPYDGRLLSPLVLLAALPYFIAMASDLKYCGYKYSDIFRIYGFNLILLPVNFAGVIKSIEQALTGKKIPFARTPKVKNRTAVPIIYIIVPLLIVGFSVFTFLRNIESANWGNAIFAGFNAIAATWAIIAYFGLGNMLVDIWLGFTGLLFVEKKRTNLAIMPNQNQLDWRVVLYHGEAKGKVPHASLSDLVADPSYYQEPGSSK